MFLPERIFKGTTWLLFLFLFTYLLLRVFITETLHDEVATYMYYIYHGDFIGKDIVWDANNHLLNSLLGRCLYLLFGDHFAILRMPNVLAFILYFFASRKLVANLNAKYLNSIGLIALNTLPFVFEYFGNCRGYGLSLGCLLWVFVFINNYKNSLRTKDLILAFIFLILAISANLTLLNTGLLIFCYTLIITFFNKQVNNDKRWLKTTIHLLFLAFISPLIYFGIRLKNSGALYYGSHDGLWDVTGKTLTQYTFFHSTDWIMYLYLILFIVIGFLLVKSYFKSGLIDFLHQSLSFYSYLFFGNIIGILALALLLNVNYPEDRTAMYLIPLFLLILLELIDTHFFLRFFKWLFIFFPISFLFKLSLHTSVFSPDDRMTRQFYNTVKQEIKSDHSLMIYPIMGWNWTYLESKQKTKASVANSHNPNTVFADILLTKSTVLKNKDIYKYYTLFAEEKDATYLAFKRKIALQKKLLIQSESISSSGNAIYHNLYKNDSLPKLTSGALQISVSGHLKTFKRENKIQLVVETKSKEGEAGHYLYYPFEFTYQGKKIDDNFTHHFLIEKPTEQDQYLNVYLWNRNGDNLTITDGKCYIYEVKNPRNGTR